MSPARPRPMDGSWRLTCARGSLVGRSGEFKPAIDRASRWLLDHNVSTVNDAAVMLMATAPLSSARAATLRERSVSLLRKAQSDEGGWGPFVTSPPEAFDTALVLIALARAGDPVERAT